MKEMKEIRDKIYKSLKNTIDYNHDSIIKNVNAVMNSLHNQDKIYDFHVVCDKTNNQFDKNYTNVDIYFKQKVSTEIMINNITIMPNENKIRIDKLRKERKEKLKTLYDS